MVDTLLNSFTHEHEKKRVVRFFYLTLKEYKT